MTVYEKIKPDEDGLAIALASKALKAARGMSTANPGSIFIPNGDGTGTLIGQAGGTDSTGGSNGVVPWVGDTTPPGKPTGCSVSSAWGTIYCKWDGTLEGGVPSDFAYVSVSIAGAEMGRMQKAGSLAFDGYSHGQAVEVSFTAYDDAHDQFGNPAPNASGATVVSVTVSDEKAAIDAEVEGIKDQMEQTSSELDQAKQDAQEAKEAAQQAAEKADAAADKADSYQSQIDDVTATVNGVEQEVDGFSTRIQGAVEDAAQALTAATEASQDLEGFKTTVSQTYQVKGDYATSSDLSEAIAQEVLDRNSAISQSASEITSTVSETYATKQSVSQVDSKADAAQEAAETAQGDLDAYKGTVTSTYATKTEVTQTASEIKQEVSETYQVKGDYLTEDEASQSYASKSELTQTADSIKAEVELNSALILDGDGGVVSIPENAGMPPRNVTVYGQTRQNLWVNPTGKAYSITATENDDGSLTLSGASTAPESIRSKDQYTIRPGSTYTVSIDKSTNTGDWHMSLGVFFYDQDRVGISNYHFGFDSGSLSRTFTAPANAAYFKCCFYYDAKAVGRSVSGTYRVMLNEGSEAEPWCPPGLNSVAEVSVSQSGINMLDRASFTRHSVTSCSYDPITDTYTYSGSATSNSGGITFDDQVFPPGTYTMKSNGQVVHMITDATVGTYNSVYAGWGMPYYNTQANNVVTRTFNRPFKIGFVLAPGSGSFRVTFVREDASTSFDGSQAYVTEIPLLGNELRSLPDGTRDELHIDCDGNVTLRKRVGYADIPTDAADVVWEDEYPRICFNIPDKSITATTGAAELLRCDKVPPRLSTQNASSGTYVVTTTSAAAYIRVDGATSAVDVISKVGGGQILYPLETVKTLPLGKVDLPALNASGANVWIVASDSSGNTFTLEPDLHLEWYAQNAAALTGFASKAELEVAADAIRSEVEETYQSKDGMSDYATVSSVEQTASEIESNVAATYQTKAGMSAYATNSSVTQTANSIKQEVAAEYTTKEDAEATYATKTSLQQTEDSILSSVESEYQSKDGMSSYATKSYVDQQDSSIKSTVSSVQTTANNALSKASTVEQTAEGLEVRLTQAEKDVDTAQSTANTAKTNAATAQSTANTANTTANAAKTAAATAQTTATNAAKTATNFLKFDSAGLCVGDQTASTLGYNALITSSAYKLRNGTTELASFGATLCEIGKNSTASQLKLCAGKALIQYSSNPTPLAGGFGVANVGNSFLDLNSGSADIRLSNGRYVAINGTDVFLNGSSVYKGTFNNGLPLIGWKRLWYQPGGTTSRNIKCSETLTNFKVLVMMFQTNDGTTSSSVFMGPWNNAKWNVSAVDANPSNVCIKTDVFNISGANLVGVSGENRESAVHDDNTCGGTANFTCIKPFAVYGFK